MTKYDTIRSYGAKFTYQKLAVKPDFVFDAAPNQDKNAAASPSVGDSVSAANAG